jgi:hypothetical protein
MIDGIPQSNPLRPTGREMHTIDSSMIERIEVIKGKRQQRRRRNGRGDQYHHETGAAGQRKPAFQRRNYHPYGGV